MTIAKPVANEVPVTTVARLPLLTPRERAIAERVARGERNKQIALDLGLAEGTVKLHISHVFRKLGIANRVLLSRLLAETPPDSRD